MTPRTPKSGPIILGLACGAMAGLGLLVGLLLGQRSDRGDSRADLEAGRARTEALGEDLSRARLELADAKDAARKAEGLLAESRAEAAVLRADLERVGAERDEHLAVRITLERKLDDALELLATRGK
ncbi:MAG: hypothetical protein MUE73_05915 [Planctomycetes bacterium]|jgi:hypothetical protein|nr:hypothetical protein [Planctomycetota bacterium]